MYGFLAKELVGISSESANDKNDIFYLGIVIKQQASKVTQGPYGPGVEGIRIGRRLPIQN